MKAWIREALVAFDLHVKANYNGHYNEYQARAWFRRSHWQKYKEKYKENNFIKAVERLYPKSEYYCSWCKDTGCTCGGIGLSCQGCCPCRFENPHTFFLFT
jgi:hypothetical protein